MRPKQEIKRRLSIALIGPIRFYFGLAVGILFSILIYAFFAYFREILRFQTLDSDLITLSFSETIAYNLFFAGISVTAGFGFTVWTWFHGMSARYEPRRRLNYISAYSIFWSMALLYVVAKGGVNLTFILYGVVGYDNHLNLAKEFPELLMLMPTLGFLHIWTPIRLTFQSGKWMLLSVVVWVVWSVLLAFSFPLDSSHLDKLGEKRLAPYNRIVDDEIIRARNRGLEFSPDAIEAIRYNTKGRSIAQMKALKDRFMSKRPVPADSIALELITVRKSPVRMLPRSQYFNDQALWPFALPGHVYKQLQINQDSIAKVYLGEILVEYDSIFNGMWHDEMWNDELSQKFENREFMRRYFRDIRLEFELYSSEASPLEFEKQD